MKSYSEVNFKSYNGIHYFCLFCDENEQKGGKNGGAKSKGNGKHRYEANQKCVLAVIIALHLFCKNACFQNFFGCLLRFMLIDELLFLKGKTKLQKRRTIKRRLQNR